MRCLPERVKRIAPHITTWASLLSRQDIREKNGQRLLSVPSLYAFNDLHHYAAVQCYGHEWDKTFQDLQQGGLRLLNHTCAVLIIDDFFIIPVDLIQTEIFGGQLTLYVKDGQVFDASIKSANAREVTKVHTVAQIEQLALKQKHQFHLSVLATTLNEEERDHLMQMLTKSPGSLELRHTVRLTSKTNLTDYRRMIAAIARLTSRLTPPRRDFIRFSSRISEGWS